MAKIWKRAPTPCVKICKFDGAGLCKGCSMTRSEKKDSKRMEAKSDKQALLRLLVARLEGLGRLHYWTRMYRRKCERRGVDCPLDKLDGERVATRQAS